MDSVYASEVAHIDAHIFFLEDFFLFDTKKATLEGGNKVHN